MDEVRTFYVEIAGRIPLTRGWQDVILRRLTLNDIMLSLSSAADNPKVGRCVVDIFPSNITLSDAWEIKRALERIKEKGKRVTAILRTGGIPEILMAKSADECFILKSANIFMLGLSVDYSLFGGTAEKLGISFDIVKSGRLKSIPEMVKNKKLPKDIRDSTERLLREIIEALERETGISEGILTGGIFNWRKAVKLGLADDAINETKDLKIGSNVITPKPYYRIPVGKTLAIVSINGTISDGRIHGYGFVNPHAIARLLDRLAQSSRVLGIVLRVNSRGGDAEGSERIFSKVADVKTKKPVVVSMGRVAASGGYLLSCSATKIFATEFTIAGSIGVFLIKPIMTDFYEKIGLKTETIKVGEHSDMFSPSRKLSDKEKKMLKEIIEDYHRVFKEKVSASRGLKQQDVEKIATGEVFTGVSAKSLGLVDEIGNLNDALEWTAMMAGVEKASYSEYPKFGLRDILVGGEISTKILALALNAP